MHKLHLTRKNKKPEIMTDIQFLTVFHFRQTDYYQNIRPDSSDLPIPDTVPDIFYRGLIGFRNFSG